MAKVADFIKALSALSGVDGYLLAEGRGQILSHNLSDCDSYMPWVQTLVQRCTLLSASLNGDQLRGLFFQEDDRLIYLFPIRQYQLVVMQHAESHNVDLFEQIEALIQETVESG
ncbi:hypothetical protein [uncultured Desulfuromonas sp.]|uniref:hypothetical protein n=1 Tax=uncultured Desulfuromonas sp. TaxID=181013 RepID=UPI002AAB62C1|nr:hypothetical protein [uncultured Desulfuromonas sp.]